jgi:hypothetical protein
VLYVHTRGVEFQPEAFAELRQQVRVVDGWAPDFDAQFRAALGRLWDEPHTPEASFVRQFVTSDADPDVVVRAAVGTVLGLATRGAVRDARAA